MTIFTIDEQNNITAFRSAEEAAASASTGDSFSSQKELAEMAEVWPADRLLAIWNSLPGVTPVESFKSHKSAASRIWARIQGLDDPAKLEAHAAKPKAQRKAKGGAQAAKGVPAKGKASKKATATKNALLLDGEELIGAKQDRVLNLTILAPPKRLTVIPVSCVAAGRWHMASAAFRPAPHVMYARGRAARTSQITRSMRSTRTPRSDQSAVWSDIAAKASRMDAASPTQAMAAVYDQHALTTEEYVRACDCAPRQAGVVFAIDGRAVGMDLFDHPHTLRRLFPKLVRSYAIDALETTTEAVPRRIDHPSIKDVMEGIATASIFAQPAVGLGQDVRIGGKRMSGARCGRLIAISTSARLRWAQPTPTAPSARASVGRRNDVTRRSGCLWLAGRLGGIACCSPQRPMLRVYPSCPDGLRLSATTLGTAWHRKPERAAFGPPFFVTLALRAGRRPARSIRPPDSRKLQDGAVGARAA